MLEGFAGRVLVVVGDVILDRFVYGRAERVSPEAPALVLAIEKDQWILGGAANVAANIAALGGEPVLIGRVGADDGAAMIDSLASRFNGLFRCAMTVDTAAPTTVKTRYVAGDRHLLRADHELIGLSPAAEADIIASVRRAIPDADAVVISDYAKGVITDAVLAAVFETAAAHCKPVIVDPKRRDLAAYRGAAALTPNRRELAHATGLDCATADGVDAAAARVVEETGAAVLVTRSEEGVSLHRPDVPVWRAAASARRVRDVSGAGDTILSVMALALASGRDLVAAARLANLAAGVAVGKSGTSTVSPAELRAAEAYAKAMHGRTLASGGGGKQSSATDAVSRREEWRDEGLVVGFTNGCFDLLHPGHIRILRGAATHCDRLIVGLNSDASVRRLKGASRPVQTETARAEVLEALEPVDLVVIFEEDTPLNLIEMLVPDVLIKGADYRADEVVGGDVVKAYGGRVVLIELAPGHSTTSLIARSRSDPSAI